MKNLNIHILYLKAERPNRYKFLTENVDKIKTTSTLEEGELPPTKVGGFLLQRLYLLCHTSV